MAEEAPPPVPPGVVDKFALFTMAIDDVESLNLSLALGPPPEAKEERKQGPGEAERGKVINLADAMRRWAKFSASATVIQRAVRSWLARRGFRARAPLEIMAAKAEAESVLLADRRAAAVNELIETEEAYLNKLRLLRTFYIEPLTDMLAESKPLLSASQLRSLTSTLDPLLKLTETTLGKLHAAVEAAGGDLTRAAVGAALAELVPYLKQYKAYANNYQYVMAVLETAKADSSAMAKFLDDAYHASGRNPYSMLLMQPIQRLPRYLLLFKVVFKATPATHPDTVPVSDIITSLEEVLVDVDAEVSRARNVNTMLALQERLTGAAPILVADSRALVHQGLLVLASGDVREAFLFTDMLLLCTQVKSGPKLKVKDVLAVPTMYVTGLPDDAEDRSELGFRIVAVSKVITVFARNADDRADWITAVLTLVADHVRRDPSLVAARRPSPEASDGTGSANIPPALIPSSVHPTPSIELPALDVDNLRSIFTIRYLRASVLAEYEGVLSKRGVRNTSFRKRTFILLDKFLYYFKSTKKAAVPAGVIPLTRTSLVQSRESANSSQGGPERRTFHLQARSFAEYIDLKQAVHKSLETPLKIPGPGFEFLLSNMVGKDCTNAVVNQAVQQLAAFTLAPISDKRYTIINRTGLDNVVGAICHVLTTTVAEDAAKYACVCIRNLAHSRETAAAIHDVAVPSLIWILLRTAPYVTPIVKREAVYALLHINTLSQPILYAETRAESLSTAVLKYLASTSHVAGDPLSIEVVSAMFADVASKAFRRTAVLNKPNFANVVTTLLRLSDYPATAAHAASALGSLASHSTMCQQLRSAGKTSLLELNAEWAALLVSHLSSDKIYLVRAALLAIRNLISRSVVPRASATTAVRRLLAAGLLPQVTTIARGEHETDVRNGCRLHALALLVSLTAYDTPMTSLLDSGGLELVRSVLADVSAALDSASDGSALDATLIKLLCLGGSSGPSRILDTALFDDPDYEPGLVSGEAAGYALDLLTHLTSTPLFSVAALPSLMMPGGRASSLVPASAIPNLADAALAFDPLALWALLSQLAKNSVLPINVRSRALASLSRGLSIDFGESRAAIAGSLVDDDELLQVIATALDWEAALAHAADVGSLTESTCVLAPERLDADVVEFLVKYEGMTHTPAIVAARDSGTLLSSFTVPPPVLFRGSTVESRHMLSAIQLAIAAADTIAALWASVTPSKQAVLGKFGSLLIDGVLEVLPECKLTVRVRVAFLRAVAAIHGHTAFRPNLEAQILRAVLDHPLGSSEEGSRVSAMLALQDLLRATSLNATSDAAGEVGGSRVNPAEAVLASFAPGAAPDPGAGLATYAALTARATPGASIVHTDMDTVVISSPYNACGPTQMSLCVGDRVLVVHRASAIWWYGVCGNRRGYFPTSAVSLD
ncbi:uncharacterized protein AMSG_02392 [Thecamonas trahens ATCC 50062]|uniref:Uncharacterized protein n=1 Tax=Thecamonas trahens ATCC 50062 TaxID=461836 RepID=A0A0L0DW67_THETB|nr:hypothetical protein AMSG_02392 [Thecamonas trahens ATCC 50062]KNC56422.1 hypothetical protein AMSG_02392 [Thecamonas trahens ATCC 50062]|eukprot:XP_013760934.1 hypothetical protein AMSG_02392 [Thecamonas trahens ATCC 50062]